MDFKWLLELIVQVSSTAGRNIYLGYQVTKLDKENKIFTKNLCTIPLSWILIIELEQEQNKIGISVQKKKKNISHT